MPIHKKTFKKVKKTVKKTVRSVTRHRGPSFRKVVKAAKKINPFGAFRKITKTLRESTKRTRR